MADNNQPKRRSPKARRPIPAHWKYHMDRRGIPSIRQLAMRANMSQPPIEGVIYGDSKNPSGRTLEAIARALEIPLHDVYFLADQVQPHAEIWEPPTEANLLTPRQRKAFDALIRAVVDPWEESHPAQAKKTKDRSNVRSIRPIEEDHPEDPGMDYAADKDHGPSEGQLFHQWIDEAGEESQE